MDFEIISQKRDDRCKNLRFAGCWFGRKGDFCYLQIPIHVLTL